MRPIDGEAAKKHFAQIGETAEYKGVLCTVVPISAIDLIPTIDPESLRPKGHWIHCSGNSNLWHCSACGETIMYNPKRRTYNIEKKPVHEVNKFCRNCGTPMRGE